MSIPQEILASEPGLGEWSILTAYRGSSSHGMHVPGSDPNSIDDRDVMAVCVPPPAYYLGLEEYSPSP